MATNPYTPPAGSTALPDTAGPDTILTPADVFPYYTNTLLTRFGATSCAIFLWHPEGTAEGGVLSQNGRRFRQLTLPINNETVLGRAVRAKRIINVPVTSPHDLSGIPPLEKETGSAALAVTGDAGDGRIIALLFLKDAATGGFSPVDETRASRAAREVAATLRSVEEKQALREKQERLTWENRQLRLIISELDALESDDVVALAEGVLNIASQGVTSDSAAVYLYAPETDSGSWAASRGASSPYMLSADDAFRDSPLFKLVESGGTLLIGDVAAAGQGAQYLIPQGSVVAAALAAGAETFGAITLTSREKNAFDEKDVFFLETLGKCAGNKLSLQRALERERKRTARLALAGAIDKTALIKKSERDFYADVVRAVKEKTDYYNVALYAVDAAKGEVVLEAISGGYADLLPVGFRQKVTAGIIGTALTTGATVLENNVDKDQRYLAVNPVTMASKSELAVPIRVAGKGVAVLDVQSRRMGAFDESDAQALEALAEQIGAALENAALFHKEQERTSELSLVYRLGRELLTATDVRTVVKNVAASIRKHFQYYNVTIFLRDEEDPNNMRAAAVEGAYEQFMPGLVIPYGRGIVGRAATTGQVYQSGDVLSDPYYWPEPIPAQHHSEIAVPIVIAGRVAGVLDVQQDRPAAFTPHDVELLQTFADQMAIAIQNINSFTKEHQATEDAKTLLHISHVISQTADLEKSLEFLVEETGVVMNADGAGLILLDDTGSPGRIRKVLGFNYDDDRPLPPLEESPLFREILNATKPVFIPDAAADSRLTPGLFPAFSHGSLLVAPVKKKTRVLGILVAGWTHPNPPVAKNDLAMFEGIAFQAAIGVENLIFYNDLTRQTKYLTLLSSIAADASRLPPLDELLHVTLQKILSFAELDAGAVFVKDPKRESLVRSAYFGVSDEDAARWPLPLRYEGETARRLLKAEVFVGPKDASLFGFHTPAEGGPASFIAVPLVAKQNVLGLIALFSKYPRPCPDELIDRLQTICDQLALFIENSQLFSQTASQMKELYALLETTKALASSLDIDDIIYSIAQKVKELIGADECTIFLLNRETGYLEPIVSLTAYPEEVMKLKLKVGEGITGHVALTGVGEYVNDSVRDPRVVVVPGTPEEHESLLSVPLLSREEVIGVMTLGRLGGDVFTDRDLQLVTLFAGQVAGSIENSRLFDRLLSSISVAEEHRRKLDATFASISDAIIVTDPSLRIIDVNPAAEKMLSRSADALVNRHVRSVLDTPALHEIFEHARLQLDADAVAEFEFIVPPDVPTGVTKYYRVVVDAVTGPQQEKVGYVASFRDITESRTLANLKDNFIANVSHELRTPLTSIVGSVELILSDENINAFPYYQFICIIDKEARRLRELVESILDFSLLESGELKPHLEEITLPEVVAETCRRYQPLAEERGVTVEVSAAPSLPATYADARLLEGVIGNIVKNAIRFNRPGGEVKVRTELVEGEFRIAVADTGPGVAPQELENIFSKFYQVDSSSTREVGGTGLGLAIAKRGIEAHGGRIEVTSVLDQGSTFVIVLPLKTSPD